MKLKTHYDVLKVTQDAPDEVIAAAYKALARIYHPDVNGNSPEAMVKMQDINIAYNALCDKEKRAEHDGWIARQERRSGSRGGEGGRQKTVFTNTERIEKTKAEAAKWAAWYEKVSQEAKEAQGRLDKALADYAKAKAEERGKWEAWVAKMQRETDEAKARADKAAEKSAQATAEALAAARGE